MQLCDFYFISWRIDFLETLLLRSSRPLSINDYDHSIFLVTVQYGNKDMKESSWLRLSDFFISF